MKYCRMPRTHLCEIISRTEDLTVLILMRKNLQVRDYYNIPGLDERKTLSLIKEIIIYVIKWILSSNQRPLEDASGRCTKFTEFRLSKLSSRLLVIFCYRKIVYYLVNILYSQLSRFWHILILIKICTNQNLKKLAFGFRLTDCN